MATLGIGLCGLGTVGSAVLRRLRGGDCPPGLVLRAVAARHSRGHDLSGLCFSERPAELVADPNVQVVVELFGGTGDAAELIAAAIAAGKHVVTANKALLSASGEALFASAASTGVALRFEAAVASGMPVIKLLREGLVANRVEAVIGILNGTSNFVLSERRRKLCGHDEAVAMAQQLGYAERDPTLDVDGSDAADKLRILARLAFGTALDVPLPQRRGIVALSARDFAVAEALECRLRPLAIAERVEQGVVMGVFPALLPLWGSESIVRLAAAADDTENVVLLRGDLVGELICCGAGAGGEATASAVLADLVDLCTGSSAPPLPPLDAVLRVLPPPPRPQCLWCAADGVDLAELCAQLVGQLPADVAMTAPRVVGDDTVAVLLRPCQDTEAEALRAMMAEHLGARFAALDSRCLRIEAGAEELHSWAAAS